MARSHQYSKKNLKRDGLLNEAEGDNIDEDYESDEDEERKERFKRQRSMVEVNTIENVDEKRKAIMNMTIRRMKKMKRKMIWK